MRRSALLGLLAASGLGACDDAPAGRPTFENDALWKFAPEGTRGAVVMSPYAVGMLEAGAVTVRDFVTKAGPEMAAIAEPLNQILEPLGKDGKLSESGMTATKGAAFFAAQKSFVAVFPVADRDVFLTKRGGVKASTPDGADQIGPLRCKMMTSHYVCAGSDELLATVGKSSIKDRILKVGTRGDIELAMTELPLLGPDMPRTALIATVQVERGAFDVHGMIINPPKGMADMVGAPTKPRARIGKAAGFAMIDLRSLFEATEDKVIGDLTAAQLVKSIAGPVTVEAAPGTRVLDIQMPLSDPKPFTQIVEHCDEVGMLSSLGAKKTPAGCHLALAQLGLELDLWVDGNTLHAGNKTFTPPDTAVAMSPVGIELASGQWGLAFWGRGSEFAASERAPLDPAMLNAGLALQVRIASMVNEIGFGVKKDGDTLRFVGTLRTGFANPSDVVAKLIAISAADVAGNKSDAQAQPIAAAAPRSPFATDLAAGRSGLLIPSQMLSIGLNWFIPAALYYVRSAPEAGGRPKAEQGADSEEPKFAPGQLTQLRVKGYATEGFDIWKKKNPGKDCPGSMKDLAAAIDPTAVYTDEWGKEMVMVCGGKLPEGAKGMAVMSAGPDGKIGTDDDIKSY